MHEFLFDALLKQNRFWNESSKQISKQKSKYESKHWKVMTSDVQRSLAGET